MNTNYQLIVLCCVILGCNGDPSTISDILSDVKDTVHSVANKVLGGLNIQLGGEAHVESNAQSDYYPQSYAPNQQPSSIEMQTGHNNGYGHYHHQYHQPNEGYGPYNNYNNRPPRPGPYHHYGHGRPWQNGNYNNENHQGFPHHNGYGHNNGYPHHGNHFHNGYEQPNPYGDQNKFGDNNNYNKPEQTNQGLDHNHHGLPNNPPTDQNNEYQHQNGAHNNQNNYGHNKPTTTVPIVETRPTFASHNQEEYTKKPNIEKTTTKPDEPLFVPLNPNEYVYGGEKINVSAPKRETEGNAKPASDADEDFPIDIRFQDD